MWLNCLLAAAFFWQCTACQPNQACPFIHSPLKLRPTVLHAILPFVILHGASLKCCLSEFALSAFSKETQSHTIVIHRCVYYKLVLCMMFLNGKRRYCSKSNRSWGCLLLLSSPFSEACKCPQLKTAPFVKSVNAYIYRNCWAWHIIKIPNRQDHIWSQSLKFLVNGWHFQNPC